MRPVASAIGWWPAGPGSRIDRRRWPRAALLPSGSANVAVPRSSGPRWLRTSSMGPIGPVSVATIPQMPHTSYPGGSADGCGGATHGAMVGKGSSERVSVLGCPVDALDMPETVERCLELIDRGRPAQHVVVNAAKLVEFNRNARMAQIIRDCELVNADGQSIVWAARILGEDLPTRVAGIDLMHELLAVAAKRGLRVFLLG